MKELKEKLKKLPSVLVIAVGLIFTLGISFALIYFLILPTFFEMSKSSEEIKTKEGKLIAIKQSITTITSVNRKDLQDYGSFFSNLMPAKLDMLHFASLNEKVAQAAGATVQGITIAKAPVAPTPTPAPAPTTGSSNAVATPAPAVPTAPEVKINVTYSSNFDSMINLVKIWTMADQLVGITDIKVDSQSGGVLGYTVTYTLPTTIGETKATVDDILSFSAKDKEAIEKLESQVIYTATPSAKPVGKSNPFQ